MRKFPVLGAAAALALGVLAGAVPATGQTTPGPGPTVETFGASTTWTVPRASAACGSPRWVRKAGPAAPTGSRDEPEDEATAQSVGVGGVGGKGGQVTATVGVQPGATVDLGVGVRGEDGPGNEIAASSSAGAYPVQGSAEGSAAGGATGGGDGGDGEGADGAGGGGASIVAIGGSALIVAGGGGAGGAGFDDGHAGGVGGNDEAAGTDGLPNPGIRRGGRAGRRRRHRDDRRDRGHEHAAGRWRNAARRRSADRRRCRGIPR